MDKPFLEHAELCLLRGAHAEALRTARLGLLVTPDDPDLLELAALCAGHLGDDDGAIRYAQQLLKQVPANGEARSALAMALERLLRFDEAEHVYRQGLLLAPDDARLHANFGLLLENLGCVDEAEFHQRRALHLAPASAGIRSNLAGLLAGTGREVEAESYYREVIRLQPEFAIAYSNLGVLLNDLGREVEAEPLFRQALEIQPDNLQARMNLGQFLLMRGRLAEGWPYYEGRQKVFTDGGRRPSLDSLPCPKWQGEPLSGKSIVVMPEQGVGDEIQFVRYLVWLKAQGPAKLTLVCRQSQYHLLQTLAGPDVLLGLDQVGSDLVEHDYWVFLLSLPLFAGTTLATIPAAVPYLFPDPLRQARFEPLLAGEGLRVGLVWRGNPRHLNDAERSLSGIEVLAPLWAIEGVRFFSVQKSELELPPPPVSQPLTDLGPLIDDFADTAAIVSQFDLLISVDTSVAHLAGALGVPCWVLLPHYKNDWRWLQERNDSPWYPTLRLFRQPRRGDWATPVQAMAEALRQLAGAGRC